MSLPDRSRQNGPLKPRIIIHGGAGNLTRTSLSRDLYNAYLSSLNSILSASYELLSTPGIISLDVATYAVSLLENDALYNSAHGAVFTTAGHNELECSIMVSNGYIKRGVGCSMLKRVKNPIKLARELLIRGEELGRSESGPHCQYNGAYVEGLAEKWGLDMVEERYYFTQRRWDEHVRGLEETKAKGESGIGEEILSQWERDTYLPQGTCGAVVMDSFGTICVATSTGGITNKVPGRIGDTPTLGAGFWAEEWFEDVEREMRYQPVVSSPMDKLSRGNLGGLLGECLPVGISSTADGVAEVVEEKPKRVRHAVGMSGTGNGDSFLKMCAVRTAIARSRFSRTSLSSATSWMMGPGGEMQRSAEDRWGKTIEGTGGMIGIEVLGEKTNVVFDYNCGGLCRAWVDDDGKKRCLIFREDSYESGPKSWGSA